VQAHVGQSLRKHAVNPSMGARHCHPWQCTVCEGIARRPPGLVAWADQWSLWHDSVFL